MLFENRTSLKSIYLLCNDCESHDFALTDLFMIFDYCVHNNIHRRCTVYRSKNLLGSIFTIAFEITKSAKLKGL